MKAALKIEAIGHGDYSTMRFFSNLFDEALPGIGKAVIGQPLKRWGVWEINASRLKEICGKTDYSGSNSKGSRGVHVHYVLESGRKYLVRSPVSWKRSDTYVCHVGEEGDIVREKTVGD
jgi:hypothetical protein